MQCSLLVGVYKAILERFGSRSSSDVKIRMGLEVIIQNERDLGVRMGLEVIFQNERDLGVYVRWWK